MCVINMIAYEWFYLFFRISLLLWPESSSVWMQLETLKGEKSGQGDETVRVSDNIKLLFIYFFTNLQ